ncbi:MAG: WecB/TagA/CpsF family glycosyltransferase [Alphaproteobacteria bacterium]|nr:WecB/TagA/CpsF family glycosyltransferase [Alphaproteobacteria bacterium]
MSKSMPIVRLSTAPQFPPAPAKPAERVSILGVPVSTVTMDRAIATVGQWIGEGSSRYISTCDVHCIMRARSEPGLMAAFNAADMVVPDGKPVEWTARARTDQPMTRVCGPDLMLALSAISTRTGWRHYYYGGAPGVADELAKRMQETYPGLQVAGTWCPPFRPLSEAEQEEEIERIADSGAQIVWVGLGCPKQDLWMHKHARKIPGAISIGVGAAFDFHTGRVARAPEWMQKNGLEWAHRLSSEPARLWRRYLVMAPQFLVLSGLETLEEISRPRGDHAQH